MPKIKATPSSVSPDFHTIDSRMRDLTLIVLLATGLLISVYFGIVDVVQHRTMPLFLALFFYHF